MVSYTLLSELGTLPGEHPVEGSLLLLRRQVIDYTLAWSDEKANKLARLVDAMCTPLLQAGRSLDGLVLGHPGGFLVLVTHDALRLVVVTDRTGPEIDLLVKSMRDLLQRHASSVLKQQGFLKSTPAAKPAPKEDVLAKPAVTRVEENPARPAVQPAAADSPRPLRPAAEAQPIKPTTEARPVISLAAAAKPTPAAPEKAVDRRPLLIVPDASSNGANPAQAARPVMQPAQPAPQTATAAAASAVVPAAVPSPAADAIAAPSPAKPSTIPWEAVNSHLISQLAKVMGQRQAGDLIAREAAVLSLAPGFPMDSGASLSLTRKVLGNIPNRSKRQALIHESEEFLASL